MNLIKRIMGSLIAGLIFFFFEIIVAVVLGHFVLQLHGLKYDFYLVLREGIRFGFYIGIPIAVLTFIGKPK